MVTQTDLKYAVAVTPINRDSVPMHFRGLWLTLMPNNFHSFSTPLHCGILPSHRSCVWCPQQNCSATKWKGGSLWGYCRGWLQKLLG